MRFLQWLRGKNKDLPLESQVVYTEEKEGDIEMTEKQESLGGLDNPYAARVEAANEVEDVQVDKPEHVQKLRDLKEQKAKAEEDGDQGKAYELATEIYNLRQEHK